MIFAFDLHGVLFYYDVPKIVRHSFSWATLKHPYAAIAHAMARGMYPIAGTIEILRELHTRGYKLYVFSNIHPDMFAILKHKFPDIFALFTASFIHPKQRWLRKPDHRIYLQFIAREHLTHSQIIFVDDQPRNVAASRKAGMTGIVFENPQQLRNELAKLGFLAHQ